MHPLRTDNSEHTNGTAGGCPAQGVEMIFGAFHCHDRRTPWRCETKVSLCTQSAGLTHDMAPSSRKALRGICSGTLNICTGQRFQSLGLRLLPCLRGRGKSQGASQCEDTVGASSCHQLLLVATNAYHHDLSTHPSNGI